MENANKIDWDDENTVCPQCNAFGVVVKPIKKVGEKFIATFKCHNGHIFTKTYDKQEEDI